MNSYRADLHIHTVLSPCGDLEMSPVNIVNKACEQALDIIGITDHNSTRHCALIRSLAAEKGIFVLTGAEVTTKEEVHCLAFFETDDQLLEFEQYLSNHLPQVPNNPDHFGYQLVVNELEEIIDEVEWLLINAIDQSIEQVEQKVHSLDGLFIPAHIDKSRFSLISQLGFVPRGLKPDAFEVSAYADIPSLLPMLAGCTDKVLLRSSDAHQLEQIGSSFTLLQMEHRSLNAIRNALNCKEQVITGKR